MLSGANAAAVQRPDGAWEILQFANAVLTGERTYELSRLLRGELGSEAAIGDPLPAGAPFVVLDPHVTPIARGLETIGRRMRLRVVAANRDHGDPSAVEIEVRPRALAYQPIAPVHLRARRETGGVRFTWRTRRRGLAGVTFAARADLNEASEAYELEILSGLLGRAHAVRNRAVGALRGKRRDARLRQRAIELQRASLSDVGRRRPRPACLRNPHALRISMSASANLALPFIEGGELLPDVTLNETLRLIDTLVQLAIVDRDLNAPPGSPERGPALDREGKPEPDRCLGRARQSHRGLAGRRLGVLHAAQPAGSPI